MRAAIVFIFGFLDKRSIANLGLHSKLLENASCALVLFLAGKRLTLTNIKAVMTASINDMEIAVVFVDIVLSHAIAEKVETYISLFSNSLALDFKLSLLVTHNFKPRRTPLREGLGSRSDARRGNGLSLGLAA
jgi:hypothetical protein